MRVISNKNSLKLCRWPPRYTADTNALTSVTKVIEGHSSLWSDAKRRQFVQPIVDTYNLLHAPAHVWSTAEQYGRRYGGSRGQIASAITPPPRIKNPSRGNIIYESLDGLSPQYLMDDCQLITTTGRRQLRSSNVATCDVPRTCTSLGDWSFTAACPRSWNNLPLHLQDTGHWGNTSVTETRLI